MDEGIGRGGLFGRFRGFLRLVRRLGAMRLFRTAGYPLIHFNTVLRMAWLRANG